MTILLIEMRRRPLWTGLILCFFDGFVVAIYFNPSLPVPSTYNDHDSNAIVIVLVDQSIWTTCPDKS